MEKLFHGTYMLHRLYELNGAADDVAVYALYFVVT